MDLKNTISQNDFNWEVQTQYSGIDLLNSPFLNKGSAFSEDEREQFNLEGLLPSHISSIDEQTTRIVEEIRTKTLPIHQHIELVALQNRNEVLFYNVLYKHLEEFMPIVYTPTVGEACQKFSHIFRKVRGLWITPKHKGRIKNILETLPFKNIHLIVVTDNERILGLGDQGAGGMGIPVGKLSLYTVAAGIHPAHTLAISLDVGTDNQDLLNDPLYLGYKSKRLKGAQYYELIDEFVHAIKAQYPQAVLQWEDFKKQNAFDLLEKYQDILASFNDDIQGTAGVAVAAILNAIRKTKTTLNQHRILILGAGAAGIGIARLIKQAFMVSHGEFFTKNIALFDSEGLLIKAKISKEIQKGEFAWTNHELMDFKIEHSDHGHLNPFVKKYQPTILIGTSGHPKMFDQAMVKDVFSYCKQPIIFPFSNPTHLSEADPNDLLAWTNGQALIATGSPFESVSHQGEKRVISQGNNVYVFPGVGLGCIVARAKSIPQELFFEAAMAIVEITTQKQLNEGRLLPPVSDLRNVSVHVAKKVAHRAFDLGLSQLRSKEEIDTILNHYVWTPRYPKLMPL